MRTRTRRSWVRQNRQQLPLLLPARQLWEQPLLIITCSSPKSLELSTTDTSRKTIIHRCLRTVFTSGSLLALERASKRHEGTFSNTTKTGKVSFCIDTFKWLSIGGGGGNKTLYIQITINHWFLYKFNWAFINHIRYTRTQSIDMQNDE